MMVKGIFEKYDFYDFSGHYRPWVRFSALGLGGESVEVWASVDVDGYACALVSRYNTGAEGSI